MKQLLFIFSMLLSSIFCNGQTNADTLYINLNDKLFFEASMDSSNHLKLKKADTNDNSANTISISLTFSQGAGAFLKIQNPFSKALVYKAELYSFKKKDYLETSTIPVSPKLSSFETWPYRIDKMRLTGFILTDAD